MHIDAELDYTHYEVAPSICDASMSVSLTSTRSASHLCTLSNSGDAEAAAGSGAGSDGEGSESEGDEGAATQPQLSRAERAANRGCWPLLAALDENDKRLRR